MKNSLLTELEGLPYKEQNQNILYTNELHI